MEKYKAAAYMRTSVVDNKIPESESIANQQYIIRRFVENRSDIELVSERIDDGYSGLVFNRPSFSEMIQDVMNGKINCIIVKDLSRFGREFSETERFLRKLLPSYGVRFIGVNDGIDTNQTPANDDLMIQIKTIINDEFSRELSVKTRYALLTMRKKGLYVGACPVYGYRKSNGDKNRLVADKYAAKVVQNIFSMKIEGLSACFIADELNRRKILSPLQYKKSLGLSYPRNGFAYKDNTKWSASTILRILKDEVYTGTLAQGKQYTLNYKIKKEPAIAVD